MIKQIKLSVFQKDAQHAWQHFSPMFMCVCVMAEQGTQLVLLYFDDSDIL